MRERSSDPEAHPSSGLVHAVTRDWFAATFGAPTLAQAKAWPALAARRSTLVLAPTGSGKTLSAFLVALDRLMFQPAPVEACRVLYVSPLKALGNDIERNLRVPLEGLASLARDRGVPHRAPRVGVRTGDTPANERVRMVRQPPEILITTPESLYLLLTSDARKILDRIDTVIIDEIHSLLPTKRGAHLAVSLERLEELRTSSEPLVRIGLSATQRPAENAARFLGGSFDGVPRPIEIIDASAPRPIELALEVPVESLRRLDTPREDDDSDRSAWPEIHESILARIRGHRSTLVFANNRRLAERLTADLNDLAGETIARSHHGSVSKDQRLEIEGALKRGELPALVATSSLELGIDMGAVDQVILVGAPSSIASSLQRIGRANHQVGAVPRGALFPKHRTELPGAAAMIEAVLEGDVEPTRAIRNPLDILAQQLVATASISAWPSRKLLQLFRRAAPFEELPESAFDSVLDMLSGRFESDELADLRPRVTFDRDTDLVSARPGSRRLAVISGGTIPDRGLFGVYVSKPDGRGPRIGELDEEMVFESREGEVFLLGSTSWRIDQITPDRVLVSPAPGEPGKMPFWRGEGPARSVPFGRRIGRLTRELAAAAPEAAIQRLVSSSRMSEPAAKLLLEALSAQAAATGEAPNDRVVVVERFFDEVGDQRICVLSPFGARVHAPWATAVLASLRARTQADITATWTDDGIVFRAPDSETRLETSAFVPGAEDVADLVTSALAETSLFAARFRENAARALLLPRKFPGKRMPLWAQRRKASSLLRVATRHRGFPIVLETYRECVEDEFDLPALREILLQIESGVIRVVGVESERPSPFATSLLFLYASSFMYEGDLPLAERRAHVLSLDLAELRKLVGEPELRKLVDPSVLADVERRAARLDRTIESVDDLHDLLLSVGDLSMAELVERNARDFAAQLVERRRGIWVRIAHDERLVAVEDAGRLRDALGTVIPDGVHPAFLEPVERPLDDVVSRFARSHGPFTASEVSERYGIGVAIVMESLLRLAGDRRVQEGGFRPGREGSEWCHVDVLRVLKQRSLAALRAEVSPVPPDAYARFLIEWQGLRRRRRGVQGLRAVLDQLEGAPMLASEVETEILPARVDGFRPVELDQLLLSGEWLWRGVERVGARDGRIMFFARERFSILAERTELAKGELVDRVRAYLEARGASFFQEICVGVGGFPPDVRDAVLDLVFSGELTNDTLIPLRSLVGGVSRARPRGGLAGAEGRWTLFSFDARVTEAERRSAQARKLLERHGILAKDALEREVVPGGFGRLMTVFLAMEDAGKLRRGMFVELPGGYQLALPGAEASLRASRNPPAKPEVFVLAATDPACPFGHELPWPDSGEVRPQRVSGARAVVRDGAPLAWLGRGEGALLTFFDSSDAGAAEATARALAGASGRGFVSPRAVSISTVDGVAAERSALSSVLRAHGFTTGRKGSLVLRARRRL
ncbi:MAG: DEAD/DEAH box helicase [Deltaproteobacteria bacterium]|nr:DEAD/DEAH box helicase [Deltaproteobacteria bacterium]